MNDDKPARIFYAELWGLREVFEKETEGPQLSGGKYHWLLENELTTTKWTELEPQSPFYLFIPQDTTRLTEYNSGWRITEIFPVNSVGLYTARDKLAIQWTRDDLKEVLCDFSSLEIEAARDKYGLGPDSRDWKVELAQQDIQSSKLKETRIQRVSYRPFDVRFTYYTGKSRGFICMPRPEVMHHMVHKENVAICYIRRSREQIASNFYAAKHLIDKTTLSSADNANVAPLYCYPIQEEANGGQKLDLQESPWSSGKGGRRPNLNEKFVEDIAKRLKLRFVSDGTGDLKKTFGPEDIFHYIYAIFHSPTYRERYAEFLRIDFPRVPVTSNRELFQVLCGLGGKLVSLHLLESPDLAKTGVRYPVSGSDTVEKGHPRYYPPGEPGPDRGKPVEEGRVYINKEQFFEGVAPEVWGFQVGGYQVCRKWLKDRVGRKLTNDDLEHYKRIVRALAETIRLMGEVGEAVAEWPIR